jgi:hypothetical protein
MPQIVDAERNRWPEEYTGEGMEATRRFFGSVGDRRATASWGPGNTELVGAVKPNRQCRP